jgi:hypothetical protein
MGQQTAAVVVGQKNMAAAVILALLFGGVGLLYASIVGGIVMFLIEFLVGVFVVFTMGIGALALPVILPLVHLATIIWAIVAVKNHNEKLIQAAGAR